MKMNVTLICNDIQLYNSFSASELFNSVKIGSELDLDTKYDCLIISDRILGYDDLTNKLPHIDAENIFYLLSDSRSESRINSIKYVLMSKNIFVVPPRLTDRQIIDRVCQKLDIDRLMTNNAITFFGADSKVGTTMTAQAAAEVLAAETVLKIGFLNLSGQPSFNYIPGNIEGFGIDQIKTKIFNFVLSEEELKSAMVQKGKLHILPSVKILSDLRYYKPRHVEYLINLATGIFDIVIVDAGSYPNSGLFIGALNATKFRYMVTTQQESCKSAFEMTRDQVLNVLDIDTSEIMLIINRYSELMPNNYKLADEFYKMVHAVSLPNVPGAFWQAEEQRKTLCGMDYHYDMQLRGLIKIIAGQLGFEYSPPDKKKKIGFSGLFRKSGGNSLWNL